MSHRHAPVGGKALCRQRAVTGAGGGLNAEKGNAASGGHAAAELIRIEFPENLPDVFAPECIADLLPLPDRDAQLPVFRELECPNFFRWSQAGNVPVIDSTLGQA